MNENTAALYLRISDEDENELQDESNSISSQRELLTAFIQNHKEFNTYKVLEFCDDGFSGTDFERPQVQELLAQIRRGTVSCVIVKDFSRFGRNYIEVGNYLEQVFPFLGVRFISVNDGFDSSTSICAGELLDAAFKNLIYDLYSKDLSEKVTSVRRLKAEQGRFFTAYAPYGYLKASGQRLVIDPEAAPVVQRIFKLAAEGVPKMHIARILNIEGILTPLMLRKQRKQKFPCYHINEKCVWRASAISAILKDQRYIGDAVYGKVKAAGVGSGRGRAVPEEQWIVVRDNHEAIVPRELFEQVNAMFTKRSGYSRRKKAPLSGRIRCKACKHVISGKKRKTSGRGVFVSYRCQTPATTMEFGCCLKTIGEQQIEQAVLALLQAFGALWLDKETGEAIEAAYQNKINNIRKLLAAYDTEIKRINSLRSDKYEAYKNGDITREKLVELKSIYEDKTNKLLSECEQKRKELYELRNSPVLFGKLTGECVEVFINQVYINRNGSLQIEWSFQDFIPILTGEYVSRIEKKALKKLRGEFERGE